MLTSIIIHAAKRLAVKALLLFTIINICTYSVKAQLNTNSSISPQQLVESILVGSGITVSNVKYSGSNLQIGSFSNGNSTNIGIDEGIIISTGEIINAIGPNDTGNVTTNLKGLGDTLLNSLLP